MHAAYIGIAFLEECVIAGTFLNDILMGLSFSYKNIENLLSISKRRGVEEISCQVNSICISHLTGTRAWFLSVCEYGRISDIIHACYVVLCSRNNIVVPRSQ